MTEPRPRGDGFPFAAEVLSQLLGTDPNFDRLLTNIIGRVRLFGMREPADRITAAIIVETEAKKLQLPEAEKLLAAAALIREGPLDEKDSYTGRSRGRRN